jgi:phosphoribosylformylglycinamidine synthase subunit PurS
MKEFQVEIRVLPRRGILDPQGKAVHGALSTLGFEGVEEVHVGRLIRIGMSAADAASAEQQAVGMCRQLLANPVTEDFEVEVLEAAGARR